MGRVFSLVVLASILVPFLAAADQVDAARREHLDAILHDTVTAPPSVCRPLVEDCDPEAVGS